MTDSFRLKRLLVALAVSIAALAVPLATAEPAHADSGFCGVRVQGPSPIMGSSPPQWAYTIRNKCGAGHNFKLHFYGNGRNTTCKWVGPYAYATWSWPFDDRNWIIWNCSEGVSMSPLARGQRVVGRILVVAVASAGVLMAGLSAAPANADSGFCAVRHGTTWASGTGIVYIVHNKCSVAHRFAVRAGGMRSQCQTIPAYLLGYYAGMRVDPNWYVVNC